MRWAEIGLFLVPFFLYAAWRLAAARATPSLVWGAIAIVLLFACVVVGLGLTRRLDRGDTYVPAHVENGEVVAGHGVRHE